MREARLPASFYRKLQETGIERYSLKKTVLEETVWQYGFSTTVESMLIAYSQQIY